MAVIEPRLEQIREPNATCKHCGTAIEWDTYWTTWEHKGQRDALRVELCDPDKGFGGSTYATPAPSQEATP